MRDLRRMQLVTAKVHLATNSVGPKTQRGQIN
jgi:hypothetical protein